MRLQASMRENTVGKSRREPVPPSAQHNPFQPSQPRPPQASLLPLTRHQPHHSSHSLGHEGEFTALPDGTESWFVCLNSILKSNVERWNLNPPSPSPAFTVLSCSLNSL